MGKDLKLAKGFKHAWPKDQAPNVSIHVIFLGMPLGRRRVANNTRAARCPPCLALKTDSTYTQTTPPCTYVVQHKKTDPPDFPRRNRPLPAVKPSSASHYDGILGGFSGKRRHIRVVGGRQSGFVPQPGFCLVRTCKMKDPTKPLMWRTVFTQGPPAAFSNCSFFVLVLRSRFSFFVPILRSPHVAVESIHIPS